MELHAGRGPAGGEWQAGLSWAQLSGLVLVQGRAVPPALAPAGPLPAHLPAPPRCPLQQTVLTIGLNANSNSGYVAVGFPAKPGCMVGASAMILHACTKGTAGCANGARLNQYYLGGENEQGGWLPACCLLLGAVGVLWVGWHAAPCDAAAAPAANCGCAPPVLQRWSPAAGWSPPR